MTTGLLLRLVGAARAEEPALTLDECVALALEHNPGLSAARAGLDQAQADQRIARSRWLPRVSAAASLVLLDPDRLSPVNLSSPTGEPILYAEEQYAGLVGRQVLFDGSALPSLRVGRLGVEAAERGVASAEAETRFAVTLAVVRSLEADEIVVVAEDALERQAAFEALVAGLLAADKSTRLDLLKAQAQRMEAERALVAATEARGVAEAVVLRALGVDPPIRVGGDLRRVLEPAPPEEPLYAEVLSLNPALAELSAQGRAARTSVWVARGEHLPDLSVAASYGYRHRDVGDGADEYIVGAYLDWPLFSGLGLDAQVRRAEAQRDGVAAREDALQDQLRVDLREAVAGWRTALAAVEAASGTVAVDTEAVGAAVALLEAGQGTTLDVLTSQADLVRAEAGLVQAYGDYAIARASVERLIGRPLP